MGPQPTLSGKAAPTQTLYITHRRMKTFPSGHKHVDQVRLAGGLELSRKKVLDMMNAEIVFMTFAKGGASAKVTSFRCPICAKRFLRTDADQSKEDNLDELPLLS